MTILQYSVFYSLHGDGALQACGVRLLRTRRPGRLVVKSGRAWITRQGDLDDHVLSAGEAMDLHADEQLVVEPWVQRTSLARISSCGVECTSASRESSRLRFICQASVFCAPDRTTTSSTSLGSTSTCSSATA